METRPNMLPSRLRPRSAFPMQSKTLASQQFQIDFLSDFQIISENQRTAKSQLVKLQERVTKAVNYLPFYDVNNYNTVS